MFEDQIDQIKESYHSISERVQESSIYLSFYERYSSLSPKMQKFLLLLVGFLIVFVLVSPPIAKYRASNQNISDFKNRKNITQKIIQQAKSGGSGIKSPKKILKRELDDKLGAFARSPRIKLTPDQSSVTQARGKGLKVSKDALQDSFKVVSKELNSEQALNLAYSFKRLNSSLLVTKLVFSENKQNPGYFNNEIDLVNVSVDPVEKLLPKPEAPKSDKSKRKKRSRKR